MVAEGMYKTSFLCSEVEAKPKSAKRLLREKLTGNDEEKGELTHTQLFNATDLRLPHW